MIIIIKYNNDKIMKIVKIANRIIINNQRHYGSNNITMYKYAKNRTEHRTQWSSRCSVNWDSNIYIVHARVKSFLKLFFVKNCACYLTVCRAGKIVTGIAVRKKMSRVVFGVCIFFLSTRLCITPSWHIIIVSNRYHNCSSISNLKILFAIVSFTLLW